MSDLVDLLRSVKLGSSPSRYKAGSAGTPTHVKRSPYPTTPSKPWVHGSSLNARRTSKDVSGPLRGPHSTNSSTSSFPKIYAHSSSQHFFSSPEPPFQISDVIVISANKDTRPSEMAANNDTVPSDSTNYTTGRAESTGLVTPVSRSRPLSRRSKPLPPTPETGQLPLPSLVHIGTRRHHPSPPRPSTAPNPTPHPGSSYQYTISFSGDRWDPSIRTMTPAEFANLAAQPTRLLLAHKEQYHYDIPPPAYQPLDAPNDLVFPSRQIYSKGQQDITKHRPYFASNEIAGSTTFKHRTDPPLQSFLDMD